MMLAATAVAGGAQAAETDSWGTFSVAGHETRFPVAQCSVIVKTGKGWRVGLYAESEDANEFGVIVNDTTLGDDYKRAQSAEIRPAGGKAYRASYRLDDKGWTGTNDKRSGPLVSYSVGRVTVDGQFRKAGDYAGTVEGHIEADCPTLDAGTVALLNGEREPARVGEASGIVEIAGDSAKFKPHCRLMKAADSSMLSIRGDGPGVNVFVMAMNPSKVEGVKNVVIRYKNGGKSWTARQGVNRDKDKKQTDAKPLVMLDGHHVVVDGAFERSHAEGSAHGHLEANCPNITTLTAG
ncbi:MAG TPA: hypothetical protein VFK45_09900 [Gammaproteobacteria bacterium]|nr:hypothetical protein [Gammaproteobacteria bacterium]